MKTEQMKTETHDFTDAKVGDKVTCITYGIGTIINNRNSDAYPLIVMFADKGKDVYTLDGRVMLDAKPTLYHGHVEFTITTKPIRPDLKVDDRVIVWNDGTKYKCKRYFKRWGLDGRIVCFTLGFTAWTSGDLQESWDNYELPKPIK